MRARSLIDAKVNRVIELAKSGAHLALQYNPTASKDRMLHFSNGLRKTFPGIKVSVHARDLTTGLAIEKLFSDVLSEHEHIDMVMNIEGTVLKRPVGHKSESVCNGMLAYAVFVDEQRRWAAERLHQEASRTDGVHN
jgi:short-subunit dehydrogenase